MNLFIKSVPFYEFLLDSLGEMWSNRTVASDPQDHVLRIAQSCPSLVTVL